MVKLTTVNEAACDGREKQHSRKLVVETFDGRSYRPRFALARCSDLSDETHAHPAARTRRKLANVLLESWACKKAYMGSGREPSVL